MAPASRVLGGAIPTVLLAFAAVALAPMPSAAQEPVRVRGSTTLPGAADGWLGLSVLEEVGMDRDGAFSAVTITGVAAGGPAARAGLRSRDRVVRVNGRPATPALFNQVASALAPGETMRLVVERPGSGSLEISLTAASAPGSATVFLPRSMQARVDSSLRRLDSLRVTLVRADSLSRVPAPVPAPAAEAARERAVVIRSRAESLRPSEAPPLLPWLEGRSWVAGARFTPLNPELASYFQVEHGLLVTEVIEATPLPSAGLRPGDVVLSVDGRAVRTIDEIRTVLAHAGRDVVRLSVVRHGERIELRLGG